MDDLIERAEEAITKVFNDTSVSQSETKESLEGLVGYIQDLINTLQE